MKITISTLLATIAIISAASASPALLVETNITEHQTKDGKDISTSTAATITVESGKSAFYQVGKLEYTVTPTLLDDGTVDVSAVAIERNGQKAHKVAAPRIKAKLGQVATIQTGELTFTAKTSLAK